MKLDVNVLRYLSKDDFRVLTAIEMGQKNHEIVPLPLIDSISGLKHGGAYKCIKTLLRHKLVHHEGTHYDGYRLTYMGYDFLAIKALCNRGHIAAVGRQIGVGKESDIFEVTNEEGEVFALKLHRLGRTSFRAVKSKRDYLGKRQNYSWLYLSRLAALKEFAFMKALYDHGFPVPQAIDNNRHAVLMTLLDAHPLVQVRKLRHPARVYLTCMELISRLAGKGLIHCDFNEFNLLINEDEEITLIDFPQMVSISHANAQELFERDVECIIRFFSKKVGYVPWQDSSLPYVKPSFAEVASTAPDDALDVELAASGFQLQHQQDLERFIHSQPTDEVASDSGSDNEKETDESDVDDELLRKNQLEGQSCSLEQLHQLQDELPIQEMSLGSNHRAQALPHGTTETAGMQQPAYNMRAVQKGSVSGLGKRESQTGSESPDKTVISGDDDDSVTESNSSGSSDGYKISRDKLKKPVRVLHQCVPAVSAREVQAAVSEEQKKALRREIMSRAVASRNTSKQNRRGRKGAGGSAAAPSFGGWD